MGASMILCCITAIMQHFSNPPLRAGRPARRPQGTVSTEVTGCPPPDSGLDSTLGTGQNKRVRIALLAAALGLARAASAQLRQGEHVFGLAGGAAVPLNNTQAQNANGTTLGTAGPSVGAAYDY